jgi:dTDP-4-amino-4,6-dideoxygalactose transaminase
VVPVVDLSRRGRRLAGPFASTVERIVSSGSILLGDETRSFEHEFGEWLEPGPPRPPLDVVTVASGASAIQLALAGLGVGPGDEVIVPAFTAVPTASAVCALGATPVPIDVDPNTACLDPAAVAPARTSRTKAAIVVHLYGFPAPLPETDLPIVEDAAQAHGAIVDHARSAATCYSFYPTKNLGGIGDGGAVVTADPALADRVRRLRVHGMTEQYVHEAVSQNFRMSEIEAAWLRLGLADLRDANRRRRSIAARYRAAAPALRWQSADAGHVYHLCVMRSHDRPTVRDALAAAGVGTAVHYPLSIPEQPAYRHLARTECGRSKEWAAECISLPCFPDMTDDEVDHVAEALAALTP